MGLLPAQFAQSKLNIDIKTGFKTNYLWSPNHEKRKKLQVLLPGLALAKGVDLRTVTAATRVTVPVYVNIIFANETESGGGVVT